MITFWVSWNGWPHLFFLLFRCRKAAYIILRRWKLAPLVIWIGPVSGTLELFLLESTKIMNLEILIKKYLIFYWWNAASKLNTLASCYDRKCFCRTWILWRSFPYRLREWDKGYIYIISWLEQGCCFCEQLQHWEILAGKKILCILFCKLFMNSSYAYFLIKNLFCSLELKIELFFLFRHGDHSVLFMFPLRSSDLETTLLYVLHSYSGYMLSFPAFSVHFNARKKISKHLKLLTYCILVKEKEEHFH